MLFNSLHFFIYFPIVTALYFLLPLRYRRPMLLAASFYFYCVFSIKLSSLLIFSTVLDYTVARVIDGSTNQRTRKLALLCSMTGNLGMLALFKYYYFINNSFFEITGAHPFPTTWQIVLPMGISFYTFQTMAYTIDVYRRQIRAEKNIIDVALYVAFFPQLVAGPIMRGSSLLPQFSEKHEPNGERILSGVQLMVWGLMKKLFVADPLGRIVAHVYGDGTVFPQSAFSGAACLLATYAFAVQIYCDFSGYSDVAIGAGRVLGFRLMDNFNAPYLATTIRDFWRRWHISLSTWLRDYLYIPLGGSRGTPARTYVNLMITMLLGGLWHGASWTFVIWGGLQGVYLAGERLLGVDALDPKKMSLGERVLRGIVTFHLVCLAWVFFRAKTATQAFEIIGRIVTWAPGRGIEWTPLYALLLLLAVQIAKTRIDFSRGLLRVPHASRWLCYATGLVLLVAVTGGRSPEFIYFQF